MFWVYILQNPVGTLYVGQTDDLQTRVRNHNRVDKFNGKYTRKNGPWTLVWSEQQPDRASAVRRERQIKSWKSAKRIRSVLLTD
jgi:putative endonuclease